MYQRLLFALVLISPVLLACEPSPRDKIYEEVKDSEYVDPPAEVEMSSQKFLVERLDSLEVRLRKEGLEPSWQGTAEGVVTDTSDMNGLQWSFFPLEEEDTVAGLYEVSVNFSVDDSSSSGGLSEILGPELVELSVVTHTRYRDNDNGFKWLLLLDNGNVYSFSGSPEDDRQTDLPLGVHNRIREAFGAGVEAGGWYAYRADILESR